jgi:hypothetical protein
MEVAAFHGQSKAESWGFGGWVEDDHPLRDRTLLRTLRMAKREQLTFKVKCPDGCQGTILIEEDENPNYGGR